MTISAQGNRLGLEVIPMPLPHSYFELSEYPPLSSSCFQGLKEGAGKPRKVQNASPWAAGCPLTLAKL